MKAPRKKGKKRYGKLWQKSIMRKEGSQPKKHRYSVLVVNSTSTSTVAVSDWRFPAASEPLNWGHKVWHSINMAMLWYSCTRLCGTVRVADGLNSNPLYGKQNLTLINSSTLKPSMGNSRGMVQASFPLFSNPRA